MKIGIIQERKNPPDKRVPFTPTQCAEIQDLFPNVELVVESSPIRCFTDDAYRDAGIRVTDDVSECDVLMGVKEVPMNHLVSDKTYFFFSHTIKEQPYNRELLRQMIQRNITMVDYEALTFENGARVLGFGRYAGIVGAYNGLLAYGNKFNTYTLKPAHQCADKAEMLDELKHVVLPKDYKIVVTGTGRVGQGCIEVLDHIGLKKVNAGDFLNQNFEEPVYCQLDVDDYYTRLDNQAFDVAAFFKDPTGHQSTFTQYTSHADMYIACHFWDSRAPFLFTCADMRAPEWKTKIVADISCDIDGPVACTLSPSTIAEPLYGYNPTEEQIVDFNADDAIGVMAVDNLPCELPKDASRDFGKHLIKEILPALFGQDPTNIIGRATICSNRQLTDDYLYLQDYVGQL